MTTWIRLGILFIGLVYAGILPYSVKKALDHVSIDLNRQTLSFLSNKDLYGNTYRRYYKRLLFATAILNYAFFWLLSLFYDLGENERFIRYIDYSFALLTLLAFVPHNIRPISLKSPGSLGSSLQRIVHNLLAVLVFITLPMLIVLFQVSIMPAQPLWGTIGLIIIGAGVLITVVSIARQGVNGLTEILFINNISIWSIYVTIITFVFVR